MSPLKEQRMKPATTQNWYKTPPTLNAALFVVLLAGHGLLHLIGMNLPDGKYWITACIILFGTAVSFFFGKVWSFVTLAIGLVLSQTLIIFTWHSAAWGTVINIFLAAYAVTLYGSMRFEVESQILMHGLLTELKLPEQRVLTDQSIRALPPIVARWLQRSGIAGKEIPYLVQLRQQGRMRTKPSGAWMEFDAAQLSLTQYPAFIWKSTVRVIPFIEMNGRDMLLKTQASMLIQFAGLFKKRARQYNGELVCASLLRFLAELAWCPAAAIVPYIRWQQVDESSAEAVLRYEGVEVKGCFSFSSNGDITGFTAQRLYTSGKRATIEEWDIKMNGHKDFHGVRVPSSCSVTWNLGSGAFTWLEFKLTKLDFNKPFLTDRTITVDSINKYYDHNQLIHESDIL